MIKNREELNKNRKVYTNYIFEGVDFSEMNLEGYDFSKSVFFKCSFDEAILDNCNFTGAMLVSCDLGYCKCRNSIFKNILISDTRLYGADMSGSIFENVSFSNSNCDAVIFDECVFEKIRCKGNVFFTGECLMSSIFKDDSISKGSSILNWTDDLEKKIKGKSKV